MAVRVGLPLPGVREGERTGGGPRGERAVACAGRQSIFGWRRLNGPTGRVAQLDRASAFEAEGCRFEPCRGHQPEPCVASQLPRSVGLNEQAPPGDTSRQGGAANLFPCRSPCCFSSRPVPTRWAASSGADEGQTKAPPGERRAGQVGRKVAGPHPASLQDAADPLTAGKRPSRQWHPTALSTTAARKAVARVEGMGRSCLRSGHSGK